MTEHEFDLSRRKVLGAIGAIGAASAGAGFGTSALFSDQETFEDNRLVAGELDLTMDWEEHYSFPQIYEAFDDPAAGLDVRTEEPNVPDLYQRYPAGATDGTDGDGSIWVNREDVPTYMDNTAIDSFPDAGNDGTAEFPVEEMAENGTRACELLANVGGESGGLSNFGAETVGRTDNEDTRLDAGEGAPLINLHDVKPGDFGEVTFSIHLCSDPGNPGYVWMNMPGGLTDHENDVTEPEAAAPGEDDLPGDAETSGELAENIETALWYDTDCDNLPDDGGQPIDLIALADVSGSIDPPEMDDIEDGANAFVEELPTDGTVEAGFITFAGPGEGSASGVTVQLDLGPIDPFFQNDDPTQPGDIGQFLPESGNGSTPMPAALDVARQILNAEARPNARKVILLVTDGGPDYPDVTYEATTGTDTYTVPSQYVDAGTNDGTSSNEEQDQTADVADSIDDDEIAIFTVAVGGTGVNSIFEGPQTLGSFLENRIATSPNEAFDATVANGNGGNLEGIAQTIGNRISTLASTGNAEKIVFRGTLEELETAFGTTEHGIPLDADGDPSFDEFADDAETDPRRDCFLAGATYCFGFSWWLPLDVGNEVQSDSVTFDLGFYTEQCRNNDGGGGQPVTPTAGGDTGQ
ncbi:vWA domain-containing protein [Haloplanus salilacus]|uniref:vWA domain-containing protein n=1 Tax=Haloplanus salilacus TaxID=2949994 RepID=UPI0030D23F7E